MRFQYRDDLCWHRRFAWWPVLAVDVKHSDGWGQGGAAPIGKMKWVWLEFVECRLIARERPDKRGSELRPVYRYR